MTTFSTLLLQKPCTNINQTWHKQSTCIPLVKFIHRMDDAPLQREIINSKLLIFICYLIFGKTDNQPKVWCCIIMNFYQAYLLLRTAVCVSNVVHGPLALII